MAKEIAAKLSNTSDSNSRSQGLMDLQNAIKQDKLKYSDSELKPLFDGLFNYLLLDSSSSHDEVWDKIANLMTGIQLEENKQIWSKCFYACLSAFWKNINDSNLSKFKTLITKHLSVCFKHMNSIWNSDKEAAQKYIDSFYEETLKSKSVPSEIGSQIAEVYIEEISKNFDKLELSQERMTQLLNPFLKALWTNENDSLYQNIKEKVFNKLIESNGVDAKEDGDLYLPKFDIVQYAEFEMYSIFFSDEILDSRRDEIYKIYQKASGSEKPIEPYVDRFQQLRSKMHFLFPKTKHQKRVFLRRKRSRNARMKKRILKMIASQQFHAFPQIEDDYDDQDQLNEYNNDEYGVGMEEITKRILERMNFLKSTEMGESKLNGDWTGGTGDEVTEFKKKSKKQKEKKKLSLKEQSQDSRK